MYQIAYSCPCGQDSRCHDESQHRDMGWSSWSWSPLIMEIRKSVGQSRTLISKFKLITPSVSHCPTRLGVQCQCRVSESKNWRFKIWNCPTSGTLRYYDIIVFLWYHSFLYDVIVNIIPMISYIWYWLWYHSKNHDIKGKIWTMIS
jgi:hypothetical protein